MRVIIKLIFWINVLIAPIEVFAALVISHANFHKAQPIISKDVLFADTLLNRQKNFLQFNATKDAFNYTPIFLIGGVFSANYQLFPYSVYKNYKKANLLTKILALFEKRGVLESSIFINPWVSSYLSFTSLNLQKDLSQWAFIIGNFKKWPLYIAIGQHNVFFGLYETEGIEALISEKLGYMKNYARLTIGGVVFSLPEIGSLKFGVSLFEQEHSAGFQWEIPFSHVAVKFGGGYATTILHPGWDRDIYHKSPYLNAYMVLNWNAIRLRFEGISANKRFDEMQLRELFEVDRPFAIQGEGSYESFFYYPIMIAVGYSYGGGYYHGIGNPREEEDRLPISRFTVTIKTPFISPYVKTAFSFKRDKHLGVKQRQPSNKFTFRLECSF